MELNHLQVLTNSVIGSNDVLWVRFVFLNSVQDEGVGIKIFFSDRPKYTIGYCLNEAEFDFPEPDLSKYRVWTFKKQNNLMQLLCNDVKLYELNLDEKQNSHKTPCLDKWSKKYTHVQFVYQHDEPQEPDGQPKFKDKASDYMREYKDGKSCDHLINTYMLPIFRCNLSMVAHRTGRSANK